MTSSTATAREILRTIDGPFPSAVFEPALKIWPAVGSVM